MDLKEVDILGPDISNHWYYAAKAKAMANFLGDISPSTILDVGAGSGFFSRYLLTQTTASEAWCVDTSYDNDSNVNEVGKAVHYRRAIEPVNADLVLFMDVLEHVEDDVALLQEYISKVPPGSHFLITVPAFEFLWSGHDDFLDHKRRYTLNQLEDTVRRAGLDVRKGAYYFGFVFPLAASLRFAEKLRRIDSPPQSQLKKHHPAVNWILRSLCFAELPLLKINRLAGLSIFCLAEKRKATTAR